MVSVCIASIWMAGWAGLDWAWQGRAGEGSEQVWNEAGVGG
jgi:hypothetical protein